MSIKIGINGTASFNALNDLIVGTSTTAKKDVNRVEDWNGTIIWQRKAPDIPLSPTNTTITINPTSYSETGSQKPWSYTKRPTVTGVSVNSVALDSSKYTVSYSENSSGSITGSGSVTAYVRITAKEGSGYSGYVDQNYTISYTYKEDTIDITNNCDITLAADSKTITGDKSASYTATDADLTIGVSKVALANYPWTQLTYGTDYTLEYTYPTDKTYTHTEEGSLSKTVTVKVKGAGKYTGSKSKTYTVYHVYEEPVVHFIAAYASEGDDDTPPSIYRFSASDGSYLGSSNVGPSYNRTGIACTCFGNGYNYAFLKNGEIYRSKNGKKWNLATTVGTGYVGSCCFTGSRFVAIVVSNDQDVGPLYSSDGITWTQSTILNKLQTYSHLKYYSRYGALYANNTVYIPAWEANGAYDDRSYLLTSSDHGASFTAYRPDNSIFKGGKLCYGNGVFINGLDASSAIIISTTPTTTWAKNASLVEIEAGKPCYGNGVFCVVGSGGAGANHYMRTSSDGNNWATGSGEASATTQTKDVCFVGSNFYVIKSSPSKFSVLKSSNGLTFSSYGEDDIDTSGEAQIDSISY